MKTAAAYPAFLLAASLATLGAAYGFQYLGGLEPCILCYYERIPWMAALALSALALLVRRRPSARRLLLAALAAVFLAGLGLALYHVGVEQKLFEGPSVCDAGLGSVANLEELRRKLEGRPLVRCDTPAWVFLGLSMAAWNAVLSLLLAGVAARAALARNGNGRWDRP